MWSMRTPSAGDLVKHSLGMRRSILRSFKPGTEHAIVLSAALACMPKASTVKACPRDQRVIPIQVIVQVDSLTVQVPSPPSSDCILCQKSLYQASTLTVPVVCFRYFTKMNESGRDSDMACSAFLLSYKNIKGNAHKKNCST